MFHHIYGQFQGKFCFGRSYTKVGIGVGASPPTPPDGTKSQHLPKKNALKSIRRCARLLVKLVKSTVETVESVETVETAETVETSETVLTEDLKKYD